MTQGISRAIGLAGRYLSAFAPRGTPARPAKNIVEGKTRGDRKRAARALANQRITEANKRVALARGYSAGNDVVRQVEKVRRLAGGYTEGFLVLDADGLTVAGPYKDRKTANRRLRQLSEAK